MDFEFVSQNWILFLALGLILSLIIIEPMRQKSMGIKMLSALRVPQVVNRESATVVDVCKPEEFAASHIPDAINIPLSEIADAGEKLKKVKDKPIILSCRTGSRANKAARQLAKQGFATIYVLSGGLAAWQKENLPVSQT